MSDKLQKELASLLEIIEQHPDGVSIKELLNLMNNVTPKRTVQYRLSILIKSGVLRMESAGRSSKYYINKTLEIDQTLGRVETFMIPLSREGEELRTQVLAPIQMR